MESVPALYIRSRCSLRCTTNCGLHRSLLHPLRKICSIHIEGRREILSGLFNFSQVVLGQTEKQRSSEQPAPYAALRAMASFRATVISIIFSSLPPLGVMNISNSKVLSSLILVTLRQTEGPLMGSS